jgi:hypothetical protein
MSNYKPADVLLKDELAKYKKAKLKAEEAFELGKIDQETYERYISNLKPMIEEYTNAVRVLTIYA